MFANNVPTKLNIQEANKHIKLLSDRVDHLESELAGQTSDYAVRDHEREIHYQELLKIKEAEILHYRQMQDYYLLELNHMANRIESQEKTISVLQDKSRVLDELLTTKPVLESMVKLMNAYKSFQSGDNIGKPNNSESQSQEGSNGKPSSSWSDHNLTSASCQKHVSNNEKSKALSTTDLTISREESHVNRIPNGNISFHKNDTPLETKDAIEVRHIAPVPL